MQAVINMLHISKVEARSEHDLAQFLHGRTVDVHRVQVKHLARL